MPPTDVSPYMVYTPIVMPGNGELVLGSAGGGLTRLGDTATDGSALPRWHTASLGPIAVAANVARMATGGWDGYVTIADWPDAVLRMRLSLAGKDAGAGVMSLALSDDGQWLATNEALPKAGGDSGGRWIYGPIRIWSLDPVERKSGPAGNGPTPESVEFDRDGRLRVFERASSLHLRGDDRALLELGEAPLTFRALRKGAPGGNFVRSLRLSSQEHVDGWR